MDNPINIRIVCAACLKNLPLGTEIKDYSNVELGIVDPSGEIIIVWCKRCDMIVATLFLSDGIFKKTGEKAN